MQLKYSVIRVLFLSLCFSLSSGSLYSALMIPSDSSTAMYKSFSEFAAPLKNKNGKDLGFTKRIALLRHQLKAIKNSNNQSKNKKIILTVLTVLVFIGVIAILANLGYHGGAGLWPGVGLVISIFFLVFFLKRIWRKKRKEQKR